MTWVSNPNLYRVWANMKARINNSKNPKFKDYGGRGIKICKEWNILHGFNNFESWALQNGYKQGLFLDRADTNGNYEPQNCRWVSVLISNENRNWNKIDKQKAKEIRFLKNVCYYSNQEIADIFRIGKRHVVNILHNKYWKV